MGTRCGDVDAGAIPFIMEKEGFTPKEMNEFMNKKCGVLGVSEISSDLRDIEAALLHNDEMAMRACKILAYGIKKYIGSYTAAMNGLDAVIFTAGVGENGPETRQMICDYLGFKKISTHSFRKWYATEIYKANGYDIALVQRLLQHSSTAVTQRYIGIEPQRIERAIEEHAQLM